MKYTPILFSTSMVQAILEGRKTMTRRKVKDFGNQKFEVGMWEDDLRPYALEPLVSDKKGLLKGIPCSLIDNSHLCPYGYVGDILWVRETWQWVDIKKDYTGYVYKASGGLDWEMSNEDWKWEPSIFMPKKACRLFLKITDIKVERLHDISEADAICEGIFKAESCGEIMYYNNKQGGGSLSAKKSFKILWAKINGEESWNANPWVWVISFEQIEKPLTNF